MVGENYCNECDHLRFRTVYRTHGGNDIDFVCGHIGNVDRINITQPGMKPKHESRRSLVSEVNADCDCLFWTQYITGNHSWWHRMKRRQFD